MTGEVDTVELVIDGIAQGGEGVGRFEGRVVFATGGLPGERVVLRIDERRPAFWRGQVIEVLEAAPERVPERAPGADQMPWQHIAYEAQLRYKQTILVDQLAKIAGLVDAPVDDPLPAPQAWAYRSNAHLHIVAGQVGYYAAGSRQLRPIESDPLLLPVLNRALTALNEALLPGDGPAEVVLRASEAHNYVVAALRGRTDLRPLAWRWRARCAEIAGVVLPVPPHAGAEYLVEELAGVTFRLRPQTFSQVNRAAAETLLAQARVALELRGDERLLDLYCGAGAFGLPLARDVREVIGIEEYPGAVYDGLASADANKITNMRFHAGRVERVLSQIEPPVDAAVLDPPRRGCHPLALAELLRLAPATIVYISCHPATLARDLKQLTQGGYVLERIRLVDIFPQTPHIESVSVLRRADQE